MQLNNFIHSSIQSHFHTHFLKDISIVVILIIHKKINIMVEKLKTTLSKYLKNSDSFTILKILVF